MSTAVLLLHTTAYKTVSYQDYQPIAVLTAKIQYTAFLCAVQISITSINKASEGIVQKKGREKKRLSSLHRALFHFFLSELTSSYVCSMLSFSAHFIMDEHISFVYRKAMIMRVIVL